MRKTKQAIAQLQTKCFHLATVALLGTAISICPLALAQFVAVTTPGNAFNLQGTPRPGEVADGAGSRTFRGSAFESLTLRGALRQPAGPGLKKMTRMVIHFSTTKGGPSLRYVGVGEGSTFDWHVDVNLQGDFQTSETTNVWNFGDAPLSVGSTTVVVLKVQYPGGIDSPSTNNGAFTLNSVEAFYQSALPSTVPKSSIAPSVGAGSGMSHTGSTGAATAARTVSQNAVIYALANNNDLLWFGHTGRDDGSFRWATPTGQKVGNGWNVKQIFAGDDGVIYTITSSGDLMWYRHDGRLDGTFRWAANEGKKVGTGWNFEHVFSGGGGVIYAIDANGDVLWFRHDGRSDGSFKWAAPVGKKIGTGWAFPHVFSGGDGVIYAIDANNNLLWFRHDGRSDGSFRWAAPTGKIVGKGWAVKDVFSAGGGVIYAVMPNNDLMWYRHDGRGDGSFQWATPEGKKVGSGWDFKEVFSGATLSP
jgi:hypothetical protein